VTPRAQAALSAQLSEEQLKNADMQSVQVSRQARARARACVCVCVCVCVYACVVVVVIVVVMSLLCRCVGVRPHLSLCAAPMLLSKCHTVSCDCSEASPSSRTKSNECVFDRLFDTFKKSHLHLLLSGSLLCVCFPCALNRFAQLSSMATVEDLDAIRRALGQKDALLAAAEERQKMLATDVVRLQEVCSVCDGCIVSPLSLS
jgi:hypothetical protein